MQGKLGVGVGGFKLTIKKEKRNKNVANKVTNQQQFHAITKTITVLPDKITEESFYVNKNMVTTQSLPSN